MNYTLILTILVPQWLTFIGTYFFFKGKSGGDIGMALFTIVSSLFFLLLWGLISFNWDWRRKITILVSLLGGFLVELGTMKLLLY
jgi:hypothetical protein